MLAERASRTAGKTVEALGMNRLRLSERPLTFFNRDPPDGALGQAEIAAVGGQRQEAASPRVADALLRVSALNREPKIAIEEGLPLTLFPPQLFSAPTTMWKTVLPGSPCRSGSCWPRRFELEHGFRLRIFSEFSVARPIAEKFVEGGRLLALPE